MSQGDAERLAALLDGGRVPGEEHELAELAELARVLETHAAQPAPPFRDALRGRVLATLATDPAPVSWPARLRTAVTTAFVAWRASASSMLASGTMTVLVLLGGLFVGASLSLPGDPLYAIKDAYQQGELSRSSAPADVASMQLRLAGARIDDAARAAEQRRPASVATAARDADDLTRDGTQTLLATYRDTGDHSKVAHLTLFVGHYRPVVAELRERVDDPQAHAALARLHTTLAEVSDRVATVVDGCCPLDASDASAWWLAPSVAAPPEDDIDPSQGAAAAAEPVDAPAGDGSAVSVGAPDERDGVRRQRQRQRGPTEGIRGVLEGARDGLERHVSDERGLLERVDDAGERLQDAVEGVGEPRRDTVEHRPDGADTEPEGSDEAPHGGVEDAAGAVRERAGDLLQQPSEDRDGDAP